jgi:hypothetical protein
MSNAKRAPGKPASGLAGERARGLGDWREATLARMRGLILEADPEMIEEQKWKKPSNGMQGVPVWSHNGMVCTGEIYAKVVKLTFAYGAKVPDPARLFNASLEGNQRRAIDIHEGEEVDARAFKALVKAAVAENGPTPNVKKTAKAGAADAKAMPQKGTRSMPQKTAKVAMLSGGNPQIAKADGDAPVQAYIAAMPGWKRDVGKRVDAIVSRAVPNVKKAVKWNSPFYGIEGKGWFLSFHVFTKYVKVAFFKGASLKPLPPGESTTKDSRYLDIFENDKLDEAQFASWVKQAAALPGWNP